MQATSCFFCLAANHHPESRICTPSGGMIRSTFVLLFRVIPTAPFEGGYHRACLYNNNQKTINTMERITPFLWFNGQAEEAMLFYTSIFKNSRQGMVARMGDTGPGAKGKAMSVTFNLDGQEFMALNGGPMYSFTPAISLFVNCENQEEVDYYWEKLCEGGEPSRCGWLKDKFGLSWQIVPTALSRLMYQSDPQKAQKVMKAMMQMGKLDIATLEAAAQ